MQIGGRVLDQRDVDRLARPFSGSARTASGPTTAPASGCPIVAATAATNGEQLDLLARPQGGLRRLRFPSTVRPLLPLTPARWRRAGQGWCSVS